jgi:choline dehydrogenase-like flavoprotein
MDFEKRYDVVVAGAGVAGVAAALECARAGLKTALVEKTVLVGGLATTGLVNVYLPLCDGRGRQVMFGITEELCHLSLRYGPGCVPAGWPGGAAGERTERYRVPFNPASFILALDEALQDAGVAMWLDTLACRPVVAGGRVRALDVENKSGRGRLFAHCFIDATGDSDVAFRAGAPCVEGGNWLSLWGLEFSASSTSKKLAQQPRPFLLDGVRVGGDAFGKRQPEGYPKLGGCDGEMVTRFVLDSRKLLLDHYKAAQAAVGAAGRHELFPITLPAMAQFRTTRRIVGQATLRDDQANTHIPDSIGMVGDWRKRALVWEIPYGALVPTGVRGVLAAGRCISSETDAWEATRVIPPAALTGQVCGIAARMALARRTTPDKLSASDVQAELQRLHMPYHMADIVEGAASDPLKNDGPSDG